MEKTMQTNEVTVQVVIERIAGLHEDVNDLRESMKDSMRDIALAVNKLVLLEERQSKSNESFISLLTEIREVKTRLVQLEHKAELASKFHSWGERAFIAALTAGMYILGKYLGIVT